jgi:hypothetical protein
MADKDETYSYSPIRKIAPKQSGTWKIFPTVFSNEAIQLVSYQNIKDAELILSI